MLYPAVISGRISAAAKAVPSGAAPPTLPVRGSGDDARTGRAGVTAATEADRGVPTSALTGEPSPEGVAAGTVEFSVGSIPEGVGFRGSAAEDRNVLACSSLRRLISTAFCGGRAPIVLRFDNRGGGSPGPPFTVPGTEVP